MTAQPLRAVIVDDEAPAREGLRLRLAREPDMIVAGEFASADALLARLPELDADVLFLDVQMPGLTGLDLMARIGADAVPAVVFVTAYDEYALDAFGVRALDYLVKPYDDERFAATLERVRTRLRELRDGALGRHVRAALGGAGRAEGGLERIAVKTANGVTFVPIGAVDWIEAARDHVRLHAGKEAHVIRDTLSRVHARLDPGRFVRIHRSAVVNVDRIVELQPYFHGEFIAVLRSGQRLKVSRNRREELARALGTPL
jgi:two-component system LytT family response regulator